jgi:hypothetical protein
VATELETISTWSPAEIQAFVRDQEIVAPINDARLLPLIARFNVTKRHSEALERKSDECLDSEHPDRLIRLMSRQAGWRLHEAVALQRAMDAAILLQIMQIPTIEQLSIDNCGTYLAKNFDERSFDRVIDETDDYFVFHPTLERTNLTLAELDEDMEPKAIRAKLFPVQV